MKNKMKGMLFRIPSMIMMLIVVIGSFYVKMSAILINGREISWATPITILIIFVLFVIGEYYSMKSDHSMF
ncbi:MAG: hypothetical protein AABX17_01735 [Nanoarchaeota archaeon]